MERRRSVQWSPAAEQDLIDIWRYFARVAAPEIADTLLREIDIAANRLPEYPLLGRLRLDIMPEAAASVRSLPVHPYTIFYRPTETAIEIARVLHERQDLPTILAEDRA
jgi:toxin ParE1/3/4